MLIECDASIMAIIAKIDAQDHSYVMEELDDEHCVVKADRLDELKRRLKMVSCSESLMNIPS